MKVLLILENSPYEFGGIERHCRNILSMFEGEVDYLCHENISYTYNRWLQKNVWNEKELECKIAQYDTIHVHGFASFFVGQALKIAMRLNKRTIYTSHFHPFYTLRRPFLGKIFFRFFVRPYLKNVDTIIAINKQDKAFFEKYNSNVEMIPNWLTGIEKVDVPRTENMILAVGRNDENKALWHLNSVDFSKYEVHCVTNSGAGLDDRITIHMDISDQALSRLYSEASLLIAPSKYEAFSYVVLEALERGTPVLISDRVRIADHLAGVSGVDIFTFGDMEQMASKIGTAINTNINTDLIAERFSAELVKHKFREIYGEV